MEREKGFEPSTSTLARLHSTTELLPRMVLSLARADEFFIIFPARHLSKLFLLEFAFRSL